MSYDYRMFLCIKVSICEPITIGDTLKYLRPYGNTAMGVARIFSGGGTLFQENFQKILKKYSKNIQKIFKKSKKY